MKFINEPRVIPLFLQQDYDYFDLEVGGYVKKSELSKNDILADMNFLNDDGLKPAGVYQIMYDETGDVLNNYRGFLDDRVCYTGQAGSSEHRGCRDRLIDFMSTFLLGSSSDSPYPNALYAREKYGVNSARNLYAIMYMIGFGPESAFLAEELEAKVLEDRREHFGHHGDFHARPRSIFPTEENSAVIIKRMKKVPARSIIGGDSKKGIDLFL